MTISFARHQFPPAIIRHAVWLYMRFTLSYRDVEDLLAERGLDISYETVRRWVLKFGPLFARELRRCSDRACAKEGYAFPPSSDSAQLHSPTANVTEAMQCLGERAA